MNSEDTKNNEELEDKKEIKNDEKIDLIDLMSKKIITFEKIRYNDFYDSNYEYLIKILMSNDPSIKDIKDILYYNLVSNSNLYNPFVSHCVKTNNIKVIEMLLKSCYNDKSYNIGTQSMNILCKVINSAFNTNIDLIYYIFNSNINKNVFRRHDSCQDLYGTVCLLYDDNILSYRMCIEEKYNCIIYMLTYIADLNDSQSLINYGSYIIFHYFLIKEKYSDIEKLLLKNSSDRYKDINIKTMLNILSIIIEKTDPNDTNKIMKYNNLMKYIKNVHENLQYNKCHIYKNELYKNGIIQNEILSIIN